MNENTETAPVDAIVHTPGPWRADFFLVTQADGRNLEICHTGIIGRNKPSVQAEADAKLIAAAPELLDLVTRSYRALHRGGWEEGETAAELGNRINDVMSNHFGDDWHDKLVV